MIFREPEDAVPEENEEKTPLNQEEELENAQKSAAEYLDRWKRCQADYANLKRRTDQEKLEMGKFANSQLIASLLPILDDFERAFSNITPELEKADWVEGIRLIENKLKDILKTHSLCSIESVGNAFDPNLHEAVLRCPGEEGIIVQELRRGYKVHDKVIRPSQVMVGAGEEETKEHKEPKTGRKSQKE